MNRHRLNKLKHIVFAAFLGGIAVALSAAEPPRVNAVLSIGMTVSDLDRAISFYSEVLDFEKDSEMEITAESNSRLLGVFGARIRTAKMKLGDELLELTEYETPKGRPIPPDSRSNDRWFQHIAIVVSDMETAYHKLRARKVDFISSGYQELPEWNVQAGGIKACYFKDPDGHVLEILSFPPGKGLEKWHKAPKKLFLGIDHTALVVGDSDESLHLYQGILGLTVGGESENYGKEQELLNNVFGARLRITSLKPSSGPAVEFLEYLSPSDGRLMPENVQCNDLIHWQVTMLVENVDATARAAIEAGGRWVSPSGVDVSDAKMGFGKGALLRDRDGHAIRLVQL